MYISDELIAANELEREELHAMQKEEALKRLKKLSLLDDVIKYFKAGKLYRSENLYMGRKLIAILYFLNDREKEMVKEFEDKSGALVYHVIKNYTDFGTCLSFLYVSANPENWIRDNEDLETWEQGSVFPFVYVRNIDNTHISGFGSIGIKPSFGGLLRTE